MSPHLGCYGDQQAKTPNLDRLAQQGVRYKYAFANAPLCTPARSSLITGMYASTLGTQNLRNVQPLSADIHCFTEYLREAGYYCSNNVKEDYNFVAPENAWDESSDEAHWRNRGTGQPFFSVFNLMATHQSQTRYDSEKRAQVNQTLAPELRYDPDALELPPYYPDTAVVRDNVAAFYTQVTVMDRMVQDLLDQLEQDGLSEDTIVFFYSDHGSGLPRGKRWLFDTGLQVPLIIKFPDKYRHLAPAEPGAEVDRLVTFLDLAPTALSLAGLDVPEIMQGDVFLGPASASEREYFVAIRDRVDEVLEISRAVRNKRYKYIRNFMPHRPRMQRSFYSERTPIRQELRRLHAEGKLRGEEVHLMQTRKPAEELYDTHQDPFELNNLAVDQKYQNVLSEMRQQLFSWMFETRDSGLLPESELMRRANGSMPYEVTADDSQYPLQRILKTADMVGRGKDHLADLRADLSNNDAGVRFWAATGLSALNEDAAAARDELLQALRDSSSSVRFAAAEALCNIGEEKNAVPVLISGLRDGNVYEQLHAAQTLVVIDELARPALPEMKAAIKRAEGLQDHGWYMREALTYLVNRLST
jgi:uncharacterized sulfatase